MKKTWALKLVGRHTLNDKKLGPVINFPRTVKLLQAEHARAVKIVKRLAIKAEQASKKQRVQDYRDNWAPVKKYTDADLLDSAALLMRSLLVSLQKGRA